jgi:hypothetical protein
MEQYTFWTMDLPPMWRSRCLFVCTGVLMDLALSIPNFLSKSKVYLVWHMNVSSFNCLIWKPRKYLSSPIKDISNLSVMILLNSSQNEALEEPKMISSTYIWYTNKSLPIFLVKTVESALPILKLFSIRQSLRHSYHDLGACLSPYSALWSFYTWLRYSSSSKPESCST